MLDERGVFCRMKVELTLNCSSFPSLKFKANKTVYLHKYKICKILLYIVQLYIVVPSCLKLKCCFFIEILILNTGM